MWEMWEGGVVVERGGKSRWRGEGGGEGLWWGGEGSGGEGRESWRGEGGETQT